MNNGNLTERLDRIFFGFLFGSAIPVFCFEMGVWISFSLTTNERIIMISALGGLAAGIIISLLVFKIFHPDTFGLRVPLLVIIYLFYNVCILGFFMGVPVFNLVAGVLAGYYWAKRMVIRNELNEKEKYLKRIPLFTAAITTLICIASATIALLSKSTPYDLQGMFHLKFVVTPVILVGIIVIGGVLLVSIQYFLTKYVMNTTLKLSGN